MPAIVTTSLEPGKSCCNVCVRAAHSYGLFFTTKHSTHGSGEDRTDRIFVCWNCLVRQTPGGGSIPTWFKEQEGKDILFRAPECPFVHRARVIRAFADHVEIKPEFDEPLMMTYKAFTMWAEAGPRSKQ
jgi:hypothetical protein